MSGDALTTTGSTIGQSKGAPRGQFLNYGRRHQNFLAQPREQIGQAALVQALEGDVFAIATGRWSGIRSVSGDLGFGQIEHGHAVVGQLGHEDRLRQAGKLGSGAPDRRPISGGLTAKTSGTSCSAASPLSLSAARSRPGC